MKNCKMNIFQTLSLKKMAIIKTQPKIKVTQNSWNDFFLI